VLSGRNGGSYPKVKSAELPGKRPFANKNVGKGIDTVEDINKYWRENE